MKHRIVVSLTCLCMIAMTTICQGEIKTTVNHNGGNAASLLFKFKDVPQPAKNDAASKATFKLLNGQRDGNGANLDVLHDGIFPAGQDNPRENFFFAAGTKGGHVLIDLGSVVEIKQVNTYSWHNGSRGPQVYKLYAGNNESDRLADMIKGGRNIEASGWNLLADVNTNPEQGRAGGQYAVSVSDTDGVLGKYRYLMMAIAPTEEQDAFGNTFYSEIDVIDTKTKIEPGESADKDAGKGKLVVIDIDGKYEVTIDTQRSPEISKWVDEELIPVIKEWYPKLADMMPSDNYEITKEVYIQFDPDMRGVAATGGSRVRCSTPWFMKELNREGKGAVVHELVHVVQNYWVARRLNDNPKRTPGWVVEGIPDYIRWFLYEPESHGAEISRRSLDRARYDGSYRISGNFFNFVVNTYDKDLVQKINAAAREGRYSDDLWKQITGYDLNELQGQWKEYLVKKIEAAEKEAASRNKLTDEEKKQGWQLLFNGENLDGWHNFRREGIRPGWQVRNGTLICADPHDAGDIVTEGQFDWFELTLDYTISKAGNSGIMFHVTEAGGAAWATGPEFQLEDNERASDPTRCGWLYALYKPEIDPKTGKPLDATKPVGQWNHVRLMISPEKCFHEINGVRYFEYQLGSDDFKERVAKSKFSRMPNFAKFDKGSIALQGDHGQVSFRNIKIRPIKAEK